jgi:hypothetical protein
MEGMHKHSSRVFCNVEAYVSCRGYVGILIRAWGFFEVSRESKVAPRIKNSSLTERRFLSRTFYFHR